MKHFDLVIIGAGSGNSIVDQRFAHWSVAIIEEGLFGGTCLNVGCIPTKMFVHPADLARDARHGPELDVRTAYDGVRWRALRDRIFGRIDPIARDGRSYREGLPNVSVYSGHCRFTGPRRLEVDLPTGTEELRADRVVIAAGSRVVLPEIDGLAEVPHHTSDTIMRIDALPERMVIVGGGFVAAEFAHVFSSLGTEVTQVHRGPRLLEREDRDVSVRFTERACEQWSVRLSTRVAAVQRAGDEVEVRLSDGGRLRADSLLLATGRRPNGDLLDLDRTGVRVDEGGVIVVDDQQRTTSEGIWALGDVADHHQLKHVANHEARIVQHNLLHPDHPATARREAIPSAVFTSPQVAAVGMTEQQAVESGTSYVAAVHRYADVAYGWAMEDLDSFVKVLADPDTGRLLGAHVIGPQASLIIQPLVQAMSLRQGAHEVARGQYWIHPALSEVVENALLDLPLHESASAPLCGTTDADGPNGLV